MLTRRLDLNGDICFGSGQDDFLSGVEFVKQKIKTKLQLLKKEWFLDLESGTDWELMSKPSALSQFESHIKAQILSVPGVSALKAFKLQAAPGRKVTLSIQVEIEKATHGIELSL